MKPLAVPLKIQAGPAPKLQKKEKAVTQQPQKQKGKQKQSSDDYRGTKNNVKNAPRKGKPCGVSREG